MQRELQLDDHAEARPAAAQRPEQVGVLAGARGHEPAVGRHDLRGAQRVHGQAQLALQPAGARAERKARDADGRHPRARHREPVSRRRRVERPPRRAALDVRPAADAIDVDGRHPREVDDERAVGDGEPVGTVAAGAHGHRQAVVARVAERGGDVVRPGAAGDQGGRRSTASLSTRRAAS